ncbi:MAG: bifunctional oligoribonuclease/PAP phosphatase NrnA [Paenibacillus sp.]|nr:bifunctional oligoribonuclease/PAP phosphatase NrnA [Paenibacillus sp.]
MYDRSRYPSYDEQLAAAKAFIEANDRFLVVAHLNPDGDALSSTVAVAWLLEQLGKRYVMINESKKPDKFNYLWGYERLLSLDSNELQDRFDCVISVDCADESRIGKVRELFAPGAKILNIDHHPTNDGFGEVQLIRHDAAATVEILYDLAAAFHFKMSPELAEAIYSGLLTDTGGFRYANTTPKVMRIASQLLETGINGSSLAERLLEQITFTHIAVLKQALNSLSFAYDHKLSWISVSREQIALTQATSEDMDGLIQYPRNIEGVEVALLFKQTDEQTVKVSFRSNGQVDVAALAKSFGGGGHVRAAGCTMTGDLAHITDVVVKEVGQLLR